MAAGVVSHQRVSVPATPRGWTHALSFSRHAGRSIRRDDRDHAGRDACPGDAEPSSDRGSRACPDRPPRVRVRDRPAATGRLRRRSCRTRGADARAARGSGRRNRGRLHRQCRPLPHPRARALLAARGRIGPGRPGGRQHRSRADRRGHAVRAVPPVVDPHRCRERRDRLRSPVRDLLLPCPAGDRDGRCRWSSVTRPSSVRSCSPSSASSCWSPARSCLSPSCGRRALRGGWAAGSTGWPSGSGSCSGNHRQRASSRA